MDNRDEIIKKLYKIAANQQKIIEKMAQELPTAAPPAPNAQHFDPDPVQKTPARVLFNALPTAVKPTIRVLQVKDSQMLVGFKPGQATQANYDAVFNTLQDLTSKNVIQQSYTLKVV